MLALISLALLVCSLLVLTSSADTSITPDWSNSTFTSKTTPTLQMVLNPLVTRASPIHGEVYRTLRTLRPKHARYQSWFPYPKMAVPEIDPPSGLSQCRNVAVGYNASLSCARSGGVIDTVEFASFGTPTGVCRSFANSSCHAATSLAVVRKLCVGKRECVLPADTALFGSPCPGHEADYRLAVQVTCDPPQNNTYWDFSHFDAPVVDFLEATRGGEPLLDFCTSPAWLWDQSGQPAHHYPDSPLATDWGYNTGTKLLDPTCEQIGQWFGRLAAWYTQGGLYDEYGHFHRSPYHYNISIWEVLNEAAAEHSVSPAEYACIYDQVVRYVREYADPDHHIKFVGLADIDASQLGDFTYFLNASNHLPGTPLDWISYHRYASSNSRTDVSGYETFFSQYDDFFAIVSQIEAIRKRLSPSTRTTIDEIGVILPNDNDADAAQFPLIYWNAVAASFAYLFGHLSAMGIDVVGSSQLVGYPQLSYVPGLGPLEPQYPSVSMTNWTTGAGTPRVWLLDLLIRRFAVGDELVTTVLTNSTDVFAQAYVGKVGGQAEHKVLLVNKRRTGQSVTVSGAAGGLLETVDEASGEQPARRAKVSSDTIDLAPFAVSVLTLSANTSPSSQTAME